MTYVAWLFQCVLFLGVMYRELLQADIHEIIHSPVERKVGEKLCVIIEEIFICRDCEAFRVRLPK